MAKPNSKQASRTNGARRQPITRHPLFPAIVALWFAALVGLGSFTLSTSLLENLVLASHIDSIVPVAAPPLGLNARLLLALVFGLLGGAIGLAMAKNMARPKAAPPQVFKVADVDLDVQPQWPGVAEAPVRSAPAAADPAPAFAPADLIEAAESGAPLPAIKVAVEQEVIPPAKTLTAAQRIAAAELADLSHVELVERLAIALQHRDELLGTPAEAPAESVNPVLYFPDFIDRRTSRPPLAAAQSRRAPQETEKALREALAQLQRMSGAA